MAYPEIKSIDKPNAKLTIITEAMMKFGNRDIEVCTMLFAKKDGEEIIATFRKDDLKKVFEKDYNGEN